MAVHTMSWQCTRCHGGAHDVTPHTLGTLACSKSWPRLCSQPCILLPYTLAPHPSQATPHLAHLCVSPPPQPPGSPGYKYSAVVRKRDQRELLQAVDCAQCAAFFKAIASWGGPVEGPDMVCQHGEGGERGGAGYLA
jgi:hypothetical protein